MLSIEQSNCLEILTDRLADFLQQPLRSPLAQEVLVAQSNGMARWLTLHLAERLGICANLSVRFPASFLWDMSRAVLGHLLPTSSFDKPILEWRLMRLLQNLDDAPHFTELRDWLHDGQDDFRRHELASRIADCFDQYLVYRPDWINRWEKGEEGHWQAELWRQLVQSGEAHRVHAQEAFHAALKRGDFKAYRLPERVAIFGVSALPPLYLEFLAELARHMDIHLFVLNPCQEYWGDIQAERDLARLSEDGDPEEAYLTVGNPLLASFGKQGRDFIDLLQAFERDEHDHFIELPGDDLLHSLQADILHLCERDNEEHPALELQPDDRSLQIHVCHSAMREVEVLHDQLLALFDADRDLKPSDVIVMTPDIARYGSLVTAVFDSVAPERRIPFSVADQGVEIENPLVEAFFELLDLGDSRFDATQVLSLLEQPAIRRRFELAEEDVEHIRHWVRGSGIRWGIDAQSKRALDLPETAENTWKAGLDRLMLGYALPGENRDLYSEILPYDEVEGDAALALGSLQSFLEALFGLNARLQERRPLAAWKAVLHEVLTQFFDPREREENQLQRIRTALETLYEHTEQANFDEAISLAVMKSVLRREINASEGHSARFLGHGVTCCEMVPMRSIPFKVMCLIGMNDEAYPRPNRAVDFDLMAKHFRRGDRSRRRDDRYLFLETLLSARQYFYLSYVGQSIRDNTVLPPSVLVSELLDVIDRGFYCQDGKKVSKQLVIRHPLQAFSRRYFSGNPQLFSYAREWVEASRSAGHGQGEITPLLSEKLPEPEPILRQISLDSLLWFFRNPAQWLLQERLGIRIDKGDEAPETCEPFSLNNLEAYQLKEQTLDLYQARSPATELEAVIRASGVLPHGQMGHCAFTETYQRVTRFSARLGQTLPYQQTNLEPLVIDITLGEFRLTGRLSGLIAAGWLGYRMAKIKANDYLKLWLHHLALNVVAPEEISRESYWVAEDGNIMLEPVESPEAILQSLLELYWQGTQNVLHFFPQSALSYVEDIRKNEDPRKALLAASKTWNGGFNSYPESDNAYYQLAFGDTDPLDDEFEKVALSVLSPLFEHISEK